MPYRLTHRSFQQGLMASGLARQLGFCSHDNATTIDTNTPPSPPPEWCCDDVFVQSLRDAQTRLWTSIRGATDGTAVPDDLRAYDWY